MVRSKFPTSSSIIMKKDHELNLLEIAIPSFRATGTPTQLIIASIDHRVGKSYDSGSEVVISKISRRWVIGHMVIASKNIWIKSKYVYIYRPQEGKNIGRNWKGVYSGKKQEIETEKNGRGESCHMLVCVL